MNGINSHPVSTRDEEAKILSLNNYNIYGWDAEWKLKFQLKDHLREDYMKGGGGFLDFYDDKYIDLDRPTQTPKQIFGVLKSSLNAYYFGKSKKKNKLILLMHERMFRRYKKSEIDKYSSQLKEFIRLCKKEKYVFDTLENF